MTARLVLVAATAAALALPSTAAAQEPIYDCTDAPFRLVPITCFATGTVEDVLNKIPPP
jgi:hypothetical protein